MIRLLAVACSSAVLAGCMSQPPAPSVDVSPGVPVARAPASAPSGAAQPSGVGYYTVKRGDTLYRIALDNGQDYRDLAAWNSLSNPNNIKEGQVLRVLPPGEGEGAVVSRPIGADSVVETRPLDRPVSTQPVAAAANSGLKREPRGNKEPYSDEAYARLNTGEGAARPMEARYEPRNEVRPEAPKSEPTVASPDDIAWAWPSNGKLITAFSESANKGLDIGGKAGDPVLAAGDGKVVYAGNGLRGYGQLVIVKHNNTYLSAYAHNQKILVKEKQDVVRGQKIAEMGDTDSDKVKLHFEIRRQGKPIDPLQYLPKR